MPQKSGPSKLPKNWPASLAYLDAPSYSLTLNPTYLSALQIPSKDAVNLPPKAPKGPCSLVKITPISSPFHPAFGQSGLSAAKDLKPGSFILQYLGEIHSSPPHLKSSSVPDINPHTTSNYDLSLDREHRIGIDAEKKGNEARFINDYRGIAEKPNAEFREIWDARRKESGMGVWVLGEGKNGKGKRGIRKGEEILVTYGRGFWGARKAEHEVDVKELRSTS